MWRLRTLASSAALLMLALLLVLGGGHAYHAHQQARRHEALGLPGRWVPVAGHALYLHCQGTGGPTVLLESGAAAFAATWDRVMRPLSAQLRVCAYDRAGLGWSPASRAPVEPGAAARDLREALAAAGEHPPYVVVGHSLGALFAILFAEARPADVHALVLLDPAHPDMLDVLPALAASYDAMLRRLQLGAWLVQSGVPDAFDIQRPLIESFPPAAQQQAAYLVNDPGHLRSARAELLAWPAIAGAVRAARRFRSLPILVVSPDDPLDMAGGASLRAALTHLQARYVTGIAPSAHLVLPGAGHDSMLLDERRAQVLSDRIGTFIRQVPAPKARHPGMPTPAD